MLLQFSGLVMGLGQNFLTQVRSGKYFVTQVGSDQVSHLWFGFGRFPLKISNISIFFPLDQKNSSDWVKKYPGHRQVSLLFSVGQKYTWVGSGRVRAHLYSGL